MRGLEALRRQQGVQVPPERFRGRIAQDALGRPAYLRGALLAYAVLAGCVLTLMRTAHLDGYWATLTLVMLIGYFAAPRAIFRLCHVTHADGPVIPHSINNKEKLP